MKDGPFSFVLLLQGLTDCRIQLAPLLILGFIQCGKRRFRFFEFGKTVGTMEIATLCDVVVNYRVVVHNYPPENMIAEGSYRFD